MQEDGGDVREEPSPACRAWEDKLPPQTFPIHLFMLVGFHLCFIALPSQSEGEKSQTHVLIPAGLCSWEDKAGK